MQVEVNGTRLWFDVDGAALVPDGRSMRQRPTVVLVHGGPGGYDHSYLKPDFGRLAAVAQVVYLDLRDHGRSAWHDPDAWTFETCADDVRAFCDAVGIARPIVLGHSMGGFIVMLYGARHPGHPGGLMLQSTWARFDLARIVDGFRAIAGDEVAELARRDYGGDTVSDEDWDRIFATFGPHIPDADQLARRRQNPAVNAPGLARMHAFDAVDLLVRIDCPTLVCTGNLDPITPPAAAREIAGALAPGIGSLEIIEGAGHFPWLDVPDRYWPVIEAFVSGVTRTGVSRP